MPSERERNPKWPALYQFLRSQPVGVEITWAQLNQVIDHDVRRHRGILVGVRRALAQDGLTIGGQSQHGLKVVPL